MLKKLDFYLNSVTMYRLVLYVLLFMVSYSFALVFLGALAFEWTEMVATLAIIFFVTYFSNIILAKLFKAPRNVESAIISSLILFLIIDPSSVTTQPTASQLGGQAGLWFVILASLLAMASKYIFAIKHKHLFNPAAISLVIMGALGFGGVTWWVGSMAMLPVALLGFLVVRKIRKAKLFFSFLIFALATITWVGFVKSSDLADLLLTVITSWPLIFFAGIMLTEPLTSPTKKKWQIVFGSLVGILFGSQFSVGPIYSTPELALVVGNFLAFLVTTNDRIAVRLKKVVNLSPTILEFTFLADKELNFKAGQYAELTLPHQHVDNRGNRRYFTISSNPGSKELKIGTRVNLERSSSFKKAMQELKEGDKMFVTQIGGDFILPTDVTEKLVFVAGGVGITPFCSMIRHLLACREKRDIVLFYLIKNMEDCVYRDIFKEAERVLGLKFVVIVSDSGVRFEENTFKNEVADFRERTVYVSGSNATVEKCEAVLESCGVEKAKIKTDYFPGY